MNRLHKYLPIYYKNSKMFEEITRVESHEFDKLDLKIEDLSKQFLVDTATWGLKTYEKELGLPIGPDKDLDIRRAIIKAKMMSFGKVDHLMIKAIVEAFTSSTVTIEFDGRIKVVFSGDGNTLISDSAVFKAVDEVKPAHLPWLINYIIRAINNIMFQARIKHRIYNYFGRRGNALDGEWLLNGFINLDNDYDPIAVRSIHRMTSVDEELFNNLKLYIRDKLKNFNSQNVKSSFLISSNFWFRKGIFIDGKWILDGHNEFNTKELHEKKDIVVNMKSKMNIDVINLERFRANKLVIKRNWWQLSGVHSLGEGKLLNAEIREEVI